MTPAGSAMAQLKSRRYADKYRGPHQSIWLIGVEFSKDTRNVVAFELTGYILLSVSWILEGDVAHLNQVVYVNLERGR